MEFVCLCLNILEHPALAIHVLLSPLLTADLVPLSEHESNSQILSTDYILCKIFKWQAVQIRTIVNNGDVVNFTPKSYEFFVKL